MENSKRQNRQNKMQAVKSNLEKDKIMTQTTPDKSQMENESEDHNKNISLNHREKMSNLEDNNEIRKSSANRRPTLNCSDCHKNEAKNLIYKCFSCKKDKCESCAIIDAQKTNNKIKDVPFVCYICFTSQSGLRNKSERHQVTNLLKKKRTKEEDHQHEKQKQEYILDLDKLHENVSAPDEVEELMKNNKTSDDLIKDEITQSELRKSIRNKKTKFINLDVINCHQCMKIYTTETIVTCCNENCRESFCFRCIKRQYPNGSFESRLLKIRISGENDKYLFFNFIFSWSCFICKNLCPCKRCKINKTVEPVLAVKEDDLVVEESQKIEVKKIKRRKPNRFHTIKRRQRSNKPPQNRTNIITIPFHNYQPVEVEPKNIVQIDDFIVYENTDSDQHEEIEEHIDNYIENEFDNLIECEIDNQYESEYEDKIEIYNLSENEKSMKYKLEHVNSNIVEQNKLLTNPLNPQSRKSEFRLHKIAKFVEDFYIKKYNKSKVSKKCLFCTRTTFATENLLRFRSTQDIVLYFKYIYKYKNDIYKKSEEIYERNLIEFNNFCDDKIRMIRQEKINLSKYYFKSNKNSCKDCFEKILNGENGLKILKHSLNRKQRWRYCRNEIKNSKDNNISKSVINLNENVKEKETFQQIELLKPREILNHRGNVKRKLKEKLKNKDNMSNITTSNINPNLIQEPIAPIVNYIKAATNNLGVKFTQQVKDTIINDNKNSSILNNLSANIFAQLNGSQKLQMFPQLNTNTPLIPNMPIMNSSFNQLLNSNFLLSNLQNRPANQNINQNFNQVQQELLWNLVRSHCINRINFNNSNIMNNINIGNILQFNKNNNFNEFPLQHLQEESQKFTYNSDNNLKSVPPKLEDKNILNNSEKSKSESKDEIKNINEILIEKADDILVEKSEEFLIKKPDEIINEKTDEIINEKPEEILIEKPEEILIEKPEEIFNEDLKEISVENQNEILNENENNKMTQKDKVIENQSSTNTAMNISRPHFITNLTNLFDKILNSDNPQIINDNLLDKILSETFSVEQTYNLLVNNDQTFKDLKIGNNINKCKVKCSKQFETDEEMKIKESNENINHIEIAKNITQKQENLNENVEMEDNVFSLIEQNLNNDADIIDLINNLPSLNEDDFNLNIKDNNDIEMKEILIENIAENNSEKINFIPLKENIFINNSETKDEILPTFKETKIEEYFNLINDDKNFIKEIGPLNKQKLFEKINVKLDEMIKDKVKNLVVNHNVNNLQNIKILQYLIKNLEKLTTINQENIHICNSLDKLIISLNDSNDKDLNIFELTNCIKSVSSYYSTTLNDLTTSNNQLKSFIENNQNNLMKNAIENTEKKHLE